MLSETLLGAAPQSPSAHTICTIWVAAVALQTCLVASTYTVIQSSVCSPSSPNTILKIVSGKRPLNVKSYSFLFFLKQIPCNFHFMQDLPPVPLAWRNLLLSFLMLHSSCISQHFSKALFICLIPLLGISITLASVSVFSQQSSHPFSNICVPQWSGTKMPSSVFMQSGSVLHGCSPFCIFCLLKPFCIFCLLKQLSVWAEVFKIRIKNPRL